MENISKFHILKHQDQTITKIQSLNKKTSKSWKKYRDYKEGKSDFPSFLPPDAFPHACHHHIVNCKWGFDAILKWFLSSSYPEMLITEKNEFDPHNCKSLCTKILENSIGPLTITIFVRFSFQRNFTSNMKFN